MTKNDNDDDNDDDDDYYIMSHQTDVTFKCRWCSHQQIFHKCSLTWFFTL